MQVHEGTQTQRISCGIVPGFQQFRGPEKTSYVIGSEECSHLFVPPMKTDYSTNRYGQLRRAWCHRCEQFFPSERPALFLIPKEPDILQALCGLQEYRSGVRGRRNGQN
jgi:hypothetical protein